MLYAASCEKFQSLSVRFGVVLNSPAMWKRLIVVTMLLMVALGPSTAFAQSEDEDSGFDIRARIAALIERFVTEDEAAAEADAALLEESAETSGPPIDPTILSGVVGGVAIAVAIMLAVRGHQPPSKRDPFGSRW